jgi:hypothetical protein
VDRDTVYVTREEFTKLYEAVFGNGHDGLTQKVDRILVLIAKQDGREEVRTKIRKLIWKWGWKVAVALFAVLMALARWAWVELEPIGKILIDDYLKAHPMVMEQLKNKSAVDLEPEYSKSKKLTAIW